MRISKNKKRIYVKLLADQYFNIYINTFRKVTKTAILFLILTTIPIFTPYPCIIHKDKAASDVRDDPKSSH